MYNYLPMAGNQIMRRVTAASETLSSCAIPHSRGKLFF